MTQRSMKLTKKETSYPSAVAASVATDAVTLATVRESQSSAGLLWWPSGK